MWSGPDRVLGGYECGFAVAGADRSLMTESGKLFQEISPDSATDDGVSPAGYITVGASGRPRLIEGHVVEESLVCISVNGSELATFMCSPVNLEELALGFLLNEGLIRQLSEVRSIHVSSNKSCVDVWLRSDDFEVPERKIVTAGCGGGITFDDLSEEHAPLESALIANPEQLSELMVQLHLGATRYQQARGIHTAVLAEGQTVLFQVEDIGRHNCLDKLAGMALKAGVRTRDCILLSSGRISSEMINKARRLGAPIICSRTSPTSLSVALAEAWNMTIVAYLRQKRMRVYSHPERIHGL